MGPVKAHIFIFIIVCQGLFQREWVIVLRVYEGR